MLFQIQIFQFFTEKIVNNCPNFGFSRSKFGCINELLSWLKLISLWGHCYLVSLLFIVGCCSFHRSGVPIDRTTGEESGEFRQTANGAASSARYSVPDRQRSRRTGQRRAIDRMVSTRPSLTGPGFICIYRIYRPWWWWFKLIIMILIFDY